MSTVTVEQSINAPHHVVFDAISNIQRQPEINPDVVAVEFLGAQTVGAGTRFRETRRMGRKTRDFDLEITEFAAERGHMRTVCDFDGVTWDTTMTVTPAEGGSLLRMTMHARAHSFGKRLMMRVFAPFFRRGMAGHMKRLEGWCQRSAMAQSRS